MVSSTFKDLEEHRAEQIKALHKQKLFTIETEDRSPNPDDDVIPSSLNMVFEMPVATSDSPATATARYLKTMNATSTLIQ